MKISKIFVSAATVLTALISSVTVLAQSSNGQYIGMDKSADYDYASHTGIITLESYVKGRTKLTQQAKPIDVVLVLDFSDTMLNSYSATDGHKTFNGCTNYQFPSGQTYYTWDNIFGTSPTLTKITYNGSSYKIQKSTATNPNVTDNSYKWAYIEVGTNKDKYYLCADGILYKAKNNDAPTTTSWPEDQFGRKIAPVVQSTKDVVWTQYSSGINSYTISKRIHALFSSVENFVNGIATHANTFNVDDRISVVTFRDNAYPKFYYSNSNNYVTSGSDVYLKEVNSSGAYIKTETVVNVNNRSAGDPNTVNSIMHSLYNMSVTGKTAANMGLDLANECLKQHNTSDTHSKFVVFFTDGRPDLVGGSTFDTDAANLAISSAKTLKQTNGATIYSIYCNNSIDSNITTYMNAVSSNYPSATSMTSLGDAADSLKYFYSAEQNLYEVFEAVKQDIEEKAGVQYGTETVMSDFINNTYFKLASNVDPADPWATIKVCKVKCTGIVSATDSTRTFSTAPSDTVWLSAADKITIYVYKADDREGENDRISVFGFDYSENWCGVDLAGNARGWKLVVKVPFEFTGGVDTPVPSTVKTNGDESGIYPAVRDSTTGEVLVDTTTGLPVCEDEPEEPYISPTITFNTIRIIRDSLDRGESAIYEINFIPINQTGSSFVARISLNGTDEGTVYKNLYGLAGGTYTIRETGWNWAYNKMVKNESGVFVSGDTITKVVNNPEMVFEFEFGGLHKVGTGPEDLHNHDEEYKVNLISVSDLPSR